MKKKIKWMKPELTELRQNITQGVCTPTGSGDSSNCSTGNTAGASCIPLGNAAAVYCVNGPSGDAYPI